MPTEPVDMPEWDPADPGDIVDPGGVKATGWQPEYVPPSTFFNWLHYWTWQWLLYFQAVANLFFEQHNSAIGYHTKVRMKGGAGGTARTVTIPLGSPVIPGACHWFAVGTAPTLVHDSAAAGVPAGTVHARAGDLNPVEFWTQLPLNVGADDADGAYDVVGFHFHGVRAAAAATLKIQLFKQRRDNSSSPAADVQAGSDWDIPSTTGALAYQSSTNPSMSSGSTYANFRWYVKVQINCAAAVDEVEWHDLEVDVKPYRHEMG